MENVEYLLHCRDCESFSFYKAIQAHADPSEELRAVKPEAKDASATQVCVKLEFQSEFADKQLSLYRIYNHKI